MPFEKGNKLATMNKGHKRDYFPRVREAREALKEKALELYEMHVRIIQEALDAKEFETAAQANQWLMEHMPADDGITMIDISIDKPKQVNPATGPTIQIGFALGGIDKPKELAPIVIDIDPNDKKVH